MTLTGNPKRTLEKCKSPKLMTPSILKQRRSAKRLRRFDRAMICGYGLLASVLVLHLVLGGAAGQPTGSQTQASFHFASHMFAVSGPANALPAKFVTISWPGHAELQSVHPLPQTGL